MLRSLTIVSAAALALAGAAPSVAGIQDVPLSDKDKARLETMRKAADDLDEGADPAKYRAAWDGVLAYARTLYPADHPELAWLESELVTADYLQGDIKGALARADRIAARLEGAGSQYRDRRMELANAQVVILMTLAQHDRARQLAARVLEWRVAQSGGKPDSKVAAAYSNYANAEFEFGNYDKAISLVRKAIAEDLRLDPMPASVAPHFSNLPRFLLGAGRLEEAIEEARAAQATLERVLPANHPFLATNLNALASILLALGRNAEAEDAARKAADIAVARFGQSQQTASYLTTLAQTLKEQGKSEEAMAVAQSAVESLTKGLGPDADRTLNAREAHALAMAEGGEPEQAIARLKEIAAIRARLQPAYHRDRIGGGDRLAELALKLGDLPTAAEAQRQAQALRRATFPAEDVSSLVGETRLGAIEARGGDPEGLRRAVRAAAMLDVRLRQAAAAGSRRSGRDREIRAGYGWALDAAMSAGDQQAAFRFAQRMLESAAGRAAIEAAERRAANDPRLAGLLRERQDAALTLESLLDRQLRLAGRGADAATLQAVDAERGAAAARLEASIAALREAAPQLAADEDGGMLTLAAARAALAPDEAMLVAAVGNARTAVLAITREGVAMAPAGAGAAEINRWVQRLRASLGPDAKFDFTASAALDFLLLPPPVRAHIARKPRLLIAANSSLSALPFALLAPARRGFDTRRAQWLVRDHALVTLPSIAMLAEPRSRRGEARVASFVAVGAPQLAAPADGATGFRSANLARQVRDLPSLPAADPELRALGEGFGTPRRRILTGAEATEAALRSGDLATADLIAFATHGLVAGELEGLDEPALVLTPAGADDGLLTASEIMRMRLTAEWIILSACNTASGGRADDSGLAGLARAFLYAGGRNLLASHWAVRDDAAAYLSVETVRRYGRGADPAEALRRAMLRMIDERPFEGADQPVNWAPFVFVGR